jgi:murein DD-endopeptidase MepM/ murein hydrolase activator NlpD
VLASARAYPALQPGAAPERAALEAFAIAQAPGEPTARACLAACLDLATSGETQTAAGRKQFDELAEAVGVMNPRTEKALARGLQLAQGGGPSPHSQQQWVNPTGGALRGRDNWGEGHFGATRRRKNGTVYSHQGQDYLATLGQDVLAVTTGVVSKIGFPYTNNFHYKYVEITTANKVRVRHLYVDPASGIVVGASVVAGTVIGTYQSLQPKLPGISEHVHVEIIIGGVKVDPRQFIP